MVKRTVRIRNSFSDRNNIRPIDKTIQVGKISPDTRTVIKNEILSLLQQWQETRGEPDYKFEPFFAQKISAEVLNIPLNSEECDYGVIIKELCDIIDNDDYSAVLDLLEYFAQEIMVRDHSAEISSLYSSYMSGVGYSEKVFFVDLHSRFNKLFEAECLGYRFINKTLTPITNPLEIESIEKACQDASGKARTHFDKALAYLTDKGGRDYKNSVKESVCAVESTFSLYLPEKCNTLTKMLDAIMKENIIHGELGETMQHLYWYACDEEGVRHGGQKEFKTVGFDEAKLVLLTCSAFVNYCIPILDEHFSQTNKTE